MHKSVFIFFMAALIGNSFAQKPDSPIKFSGQIRARSEVDGRDFNSDSDLNTYTLLRTRFAAHIQPLSDAIIFIQMQDSRAFGEEPGTLSNTANLDVHQAFVQLDNLWNKSISLKVGRQELIYGNERILGAVGWSNVGRSFDGVKWTFGKKNTMDLLAMLISESNTPVSGAAVPTTVLGQKDTDHNFFGLYYQRRTNPKHSLDLYGLYELNSDESIPGEKDLNRVTIGTYNKGQFSPTVDFESEIALQIGKRRGQDVSAFMLTGSIGYTFQTAKKPSVRVGIDYFSGMSATDEDYKVFNNLFGTNHKFYGFMDYFISIPANTNNRGLQDIMVKTRVPFTSKWNFNAHYHNFRAAKGDDNNFGNELDLILNYKYNSITSFVFGLTFFLPGKLMEQTFANNDFGTWSYTALVVNF